MGAKYALILSRGVASGVANIARHIPAHIVVSHYRAQIDHNDYGHIGSNRMEWFELMCVCAT